MEDKKHKVVYEDKEKAPLISDQDEWALEWITVRRLRAIAEAFDDDASGYITIAEVNSFTTSRPLGWRYVFSYKTYASSMLIYLFKSPSLARLLVNRYVGLRVSDITLYSLVTGWEMTTAYYCRKISEIFDKMFAMRPSIHSSNRNAVDRYLKTVWKQTCTLCSSFAWSSQPDSLQDRFQSFIDAEEKHLQEGLEMMQYNIDAMDMLSLVTGPGRIEKVNNRPSLLNSD